MPETSSEPIAVIGIGCRFPGGIEDPRSFWEVIASGTDAITDIPPDRWRAAAFFDADPAAPGRMTVRQGGFLRTPVDEFDAGFFSMSPREAAALDPQQRLLLEVTWEAFEDAGIPPGSTAGTGVGSYVGGFTFDSATAQLSDANRALVSNFTPTGVSMTMLSARLSYTFDWHGPCLTIDTACSSSLVAFHHACVALGRGECDLAVAAGVNVMVNPVTTILMSKGQFLSPDARCKSFDHRANGYARGEGAGALLLKPLATALRDGDRIYSVVRGTAVNHDGRTPGISVPSGDAQRAVIRQACRAGGVEPSSVRYYEAHGTGTAVGDPIEATAIGDVLAGSDRVHWMGSVKSNIGHTEAAAGVAAVIKASLCLERGLIPPNLHFEKPNPRIPFDRLPLRVPTEMVPFPEEGGPMRAGVNSFGFGGTNAHVILEESKERSVAPGPPATEPESPQSTEPELLVLSARGPGALRDLARDYAGLLAAPEGPSLRRVCRAASRQREHHRLRAFVVADDRQDAAERLRALVPGPAQAERGSAAFVYTGMGPQWWGMGRDLLRGEPVFAQVVADCDEILAGFGLSMAEEFLRNETESRLTQTLYAQVGNFVVQAGLSALWRDWGIEPAIVTGHSVGEVGAFYAAGVYSLEDALAVSFHRASLQATLAGRGAMAAVALSADEVRAYLGTGVGGAEGGRADIAAVNSASATTLSGDPDAVTAVTEQLRADGVPVQPLRVDVAYHSYQMDEIREPLLAALRGIQPREARIPLVSAVTGGQVSGPGLDAGYWWRNVREPVLFAAAFDEVLRTRPKAVVEVGPHPVLAASIDEALADRGGTPGAVVRVASANRRRPARRQLLESLGTLYAAGVAPDFSRVHPGPREHLKLPRYPWQRERHWTESPSARDARLRPGVLRFARRQVPATTPTADVELSATEFPYLADHKIGQTVVFPGSGYLEAALALFPEDTPCFLEDIRFERPLALTPPAITTLRTAYEPVLRTVTVHSRGRDDDAWTLHARMRRPGVMRPTLPQPRTRALTELTRDLPETGHDEIYAELDGTDLSYGPAFRAVGRLWADSGAGEVFAELRAGTGDMPDADGTADADGTGGADGHRLHPALLDAALQAMIVGAARMSGAAGTTYVPAGIAEFRFFRTPGKQLWVHGRRRPCDPGSGQLMCDVTLVTDDGEIVAEVTGLRVQRLAGGSAETDGPSGRPVPDRLYYESAWIPDADPADTGDAAGEWFFVTSSSDWDALDRELTGRGGTVLRVSPADGDWLERITDRVSARAGVEPTCRGVIYAYPPAAPETMPEAGTCAHVADPLRLVQALPASGAPLFVLTRGAQSVSGEDPADAPSAAAVWGFGRVVSAERPELRCRLIDVGSPGNEPGPHPVSPKLARVLADELARDAVEEVALRGETRYVRRLRRAGELSPLHHAEVRTDSVPVSLTRGTDSGDTGGGRGIDGLGFTAALVQAPGPGEVEIEVAYVGLNFKDVLKVAGLLSAEAMEGSYTVQALGIECSGTITRTGPGVGDLRPGDEVFAHARDLFRSRVTVEAVRVVRKPAALTLAQAAALLPSVTAHQALVRLARVRAGERVLIHSAAGGVGLAAARIASWLGAEVYGTAGTPERREFLRADGIRDVADSRSTTFADDIRRWTGGRGVDVVVNSLSGEMLRKSLELLGPFGRFVELGKTDIAADRALGLAPFQRALSFHAFDYDQMMALEPGYVRDCMREVADLYESGALPPPLVTETPAGQVRDAFRAMARGEHTGKIVVRMSGERVRVPASSLAGTPVRPDATYVVTGGLGGLGRTVARMLAGRGARHLVLVGKGGVATADAEQMVADLTAEGVGVHVMRADVSDRAQVADVFARVRSGLPPVRGVFHAAADFDDVILSDTNPARLITATRPKADGAWHLHMETRRDDLDFFVLFSSIAAQLGAAGAGAYATANEFLNGLARYRRASGLPATAVGWGMIDDVGVAVSREGHVGSVLRRNGHVGIPPSRLVAELETLLRTRPTEVSVADIDWGRWARANAQLAVLPRYRHLVPAEGSLDSGARPDASAARRLREADPAGRAALLPELLIPLLRQVTGLTQEQLGGQLDIDVDSLTAVELRILIQSSLGIAVPAVKLQRNLTLEGLSRLLAEELDHDSGDAAEPAANITAHEFPSPDGLTITGHLTLPDGPGPHPAVVVCTAGAGGALDDQGRYARVSEHAPLHGAGFAVFTVDHRGAPGHGAGFSARAEMGGLDIDDIVAAARYLADLPEIDADRLSILGTSRGGYTALLALARAPGRWRRAVLIMALSDPSLLAEAERSRPGALLPHSASGTGGAGSDEIRAYFAEPGRQPLAHLAEVTAPLLLVHGDADDVVPLAQSERLAGEAAERGLAARLITVPGLGHDNDHEDPAWARLWPEITRFLTEDRDD